MKRFLVLVSISALLPLSGCIDEGDSNDASVDDIMESASLEDAQQINVQVGSGDSRSVEVDFHAESLEVINSDEEVIDASYEPGVIDLEASDVSRPQLVSMMLTDPERDEQAVQMKVSIFTEFGESLTDTIARWLDHQTALSELREEDRLFRMYRDVAYARGNASFSVISDERSDWNAFVSEQESAINSALNDMDELVNRYYQFELSDSEFESEFKRYRDEVRAITDQARQKVDDFRAEYTDENALNWGDLQYVEQADVISSVTGHASLGDFQDGEWVFDAAHDHLEYVSNTTSFRFCEQR